MKYWILIAALLLTGCIAEYKDVSESPEYAPFINARYSLTEKMLISGVNAPPGYGKTVDFYVIGPISPSWSGRELISRDSLDAGNIIVVKNVRDCTNCIGKVVKATVVLEPYVTKVNAPILIDIELIGSQNYVQRIE